MNNSNQNRLPLAAFIISLVFAGFNAIGVHFTILELPPFWGATLRFAFSGLLMFGLVFILKLPLPRGRALLGAVIFGVLNFGACYMFLYYALGKVPPGMAQVILALVPIFTLFFTIAHRQERFRWRSLLGGVLALGGIAVVFGEQLSLKVPLMSLLAMVMGAACFAEAAVIARGFPRSHPITTNAVAMSTGAFMLLLVSALTREPWSLPLRSQTWFWLAYLVVPGTCIAFILYLYVLKFWPASTTSYQFVLLPFIALAGSAWLANETLNPVLLVGAALVLGGVFFGVYSPRKKPAAAAPVATLDEPAPIGSGSLK